VTTFYRNTCVASWKGKWRFCSSNRLFSNISPWPPHQTIDIPARCGRQNQTRFFIIKSLCSSSVARLSAAGANHQSAALSNPQIYLQEFKMKEDYVRPWQRYKEY